MAHRMAGAADARSPWVGIAAVCLVALSACGEVEPYVFRPNEFDRDDPAFNERLTDRDSVTVCYSKLASELAVVQATADAECGRFGKFARLAEQGYGECPALTPVRARFACVPK